MPSEMQRENTPEYPTDLYHFMDIASSVLISSLGTKPFHVDSATHSPSPDGFSMNPISLFNPWTPSIPVSEKLQSTIGMKLASDTHDQDMFHLTSLISSVPMGFLDPKTFPLYTMMQAWSYHRSDESASKVSMILERAEKEVGAGNLLVPLTFDMFSIAIETWSRSATDDAPFQCEKLLQKLCHLYQHEMHLLFKPTTNIFNLVLSSWMRSKSDLAPPRALQILDWMEHLLNTTQIDAFPDIQTFNQLIIILSRSRFGACESIEKVLKKMDHMYSIGQTYARADNTSYNCFLHTLAKDGTVSSTNKAESILDSMQMLCDQGFDEIRPNVVSYGLVIDAFANTNLPNAASKGYELLKKMIHLYQLDPKTNTALRPNTCIFNNVLKCFARCKGRDSPFKAEMILREMDHLHKLGLPVKPDRVSYSTLIHIWARTSLPNAHERVETLYKEMESRYLSGDNSFKPNNVILNALITSFARLGNPKSQDSVDHLLKTSLDMFRTGKNDELVPTTILFNSYLATIAKSAGGIQSAQKAEQVILWMEELHTKEKLPCGPDTISYNACLDAWARSCNPKAADRVEAIVEHMYQLRQRGVERISPDSYTFNTCINAIAKSGVTNSMERAERILAMLETRFADGDLTMKPTTRTYTCVIDCLAKSGEYQAAVRAEGIFLQMLTLDDPSRKPNTHTANAVINACAFTRFEDEKVKAFHIALRMYDWILSNTCPDSYTFTVMLSACCRLLHYNDLPSRNHYGREIFNTCRTLGHVNDFVLKKLHQLTPYT